MADASAPAMRWWGWGDPARAPTLSGGMLSFLAQTVGTSAPRPPVALANVRLPRPLLGPPALDALRAIVGRAHVGEGHSERVLHAGGKGYPDLVRMREGEPDGAPDAVVSPAGNDQVRAVLELCARSSIAVVPFGGGTSVVGGLAPLRGDHAGVVALDLHRMCEIVALDRESATVTVQAGVRGPALERFLSGRELTLGHFPQSFEYVSLGGCVATRSAGQASSGYGSIEKLVLGLRLAAPAGDIQLPALPASAAGPGLRQLLIGSEGALGVICEVALRVRAAPAQRTFEGIFFEDFAAGAGALREMAQQRACPEVARLSDAHETRLSLAMAGSGALKGSLARAYLSARGYRDGCLAIVGFEGAEREVATRRRRALELARAAGGLPVGRSPGRAWLRGRFSAPYLRDELLTHGVMVETLETAVQWSALTRMHRAVSDAIADALAACGTPGHVACHVSHLYESGASLYFTFLAPRRGEDEIGQWRAVKQAASRAIVTGGGTITHHHAVGRDHAPWMANEIGPTGLAALRALKSELDPAGIMNPGKLLV